MWIMTAVNCLIIVIKVMYSTPQVIYYIIWVTCNNQKLPLYDIKISLLHFWLHFVESCGLRKAGMWMMVPFTILQLDPLYSLPWSQCCNNSHLPVSKTAKQHTGTPKGVVTNWIHLIYCHYSIVIYWDDIAFHCIMVVQY